MKYIRTKDGKIHNLEMGWVISSLYDGSKELKEYYHRYRHIQNGDAITLTEEFFTSDDIVNQADTIEVLCDEFIYEDYVKHHKRAYYFGKGIYLDNFSEDTLTQTEMSTLKGAIWTSKGLIYVAKMNDEGELELL